MADDTSNTTKSNGSAGDTTNTETSQVADTPPRQKEIGGRDGPEPTRYGDWEKGGRCIDF